VDDLCAIAGIRTAGFKTDTDFSEADRRRLNIKLTPSVRVPGKRQTHRAAAARHKVPTLKRPRR
jgi:hypothetical protein